MNTTKTNFSKFKAQASQTGQAIVLIAMLMVILLASLGLAIDGGGMFLLWRDAQNAVDTAALQAAFAYCTSDGNFDDAVDAGVRAASANGFTNNGTDNWVSIVPAPANRRPANMVTADPNSAMLVSIRAVKPSYFIQLVYGGPLEVNVDTVGACNPAASSIFEGYSIFAMAGNGECGFGNTAGPSSSQIGIQGSRQNYFGPLYTNGNLYGGGGGGGIEFYDGAGIDAVGGVGDQSKMTTDTGAPLTLNTVAEIPYPDGFPRLYDVWDFAPANTTNGVTRPAGVYWQEALTATANNADGLTLHHSYASSGDITVTGDVAGLYVNYGGGGFTLKNGNISSIGVTFVSFGGWGSTGSTNSANNAWQPFGSSGVTIFSDKVESGCPGSGGQGTAIKFSGSNTLGFGVLYAPNGHIDISGSNKAWCGALIAKNVDTSGSDTWIFGQTIPDATRLATLGVPAAFHQFAGYSCDYINGDTPPNYFLGK